MPGLYIYMLVSLLYLAAGRIQIRCSWKYICGTATNVLLED